MIIDIEKFVIQERKYWSELENILDRLERDPMFVSDIDQLKRFHYLYQRASSDLVKISTLSCERSIAQYLEALVARAYGEIHETRGQHDKASVVQSFFNEFPQVFRQHMRSFWAAFLIIFVGALLGGFAVNFDPDAKAVLMPFSHLLQDPNVRVEKEETMDKDYLERQKAAFSSHLMTHNTRVSILTIALGMTWGIGTVIVLFQNGVMLGAVAVDYIASGQTQFLLGWLLPHGVVEIPAIIIAGQVGLMIGGALIGWGQPIPLGLRLRKISRDVIVLVLGIVIMLIWAGFVEAFFSQYHEPMIPYNTKIAFGCIELMLLVYFLSSSGRSQTHPTKQ